MTLVTGRSGKTSLLERMRALRSVGPDSSFVVMSPRDAAEAVELGLLPRPRQPRRRYGRLERLIQRKDAQAIAIAQAPATASRAVRRSVGLFGHIWRWDLNGNAETRRTFVPRYIRRHYSAAVPTTRRQRKHAARVMAISRRAGIGDAA